MIAGAGDVVVRRLGRIRYDDALREMRALHDDVAADRAPATWLVCEHEPVVTLGRAASGGSSLRIAEEALRARGVDVVRVDRGGDATYHGPGMLVVYPVVKLARFREVVPFVAALEAATIDALATVGVAGMTRSDHRGVYANGAAIAAVGLAVRRMTTLHGLALDVDSGATYDRLIAPCGLGAPVTSVARELGRPVALAELETPLLRALAARLATRLPEDLAA